MIIDAYAIIVQADMDGGDSLQREAMYAFGQKLVYNTNIQTIKFDGKIIRRPSSEFILNKLEVQPGIYIRHPDSSKWYSNPETTSRDQVLPVIAYCAAYEDYDRLWRLFKSTVKRGMFAQNFVRIGEGETAKKIPDPMHLNLAQFIRAGGWWTAVFYPFLWIFDLVELFGTLISILPFEFKDDYLYPTLKDGDDVDDNNKIIQHLIAANYKPTLISELSRYIYSVTRHENLGNTVLNEKNPVMGALVWYHRDTHGGAGNPEIAELYRPLIEMYFEYPTPSEAIEIAWLKLMGFEKYLTAMD
jgi:hypothetical protein